MSDLAVLDQVSASPLTALRVRGRRLIAQPAIRRSLPSLAILAALIVVGLGWLALRAPDYRPLFAQLADADKAAVMTALKTANFVARIEPATGAVEVPADQAAAARIMLAGQGLPKAAATGIDFLGAMPLGGSRAVETARLRAAQESELAASVMAIDGVEHASVHLAAGEVSVFVRDSAPPTASVFVRLAPGRALSAAQVRAIVHLVGSSIAGLSPDRVSVVDQSGSLLSGDGAAGLLGESARQLAYQGSVEDNLRRRVVALLTPILGAGNISAEITADLDFSVSEATRESFDKEGVIRTDAGGSTTDASLPPARGIPGALSNTAPPAAQVSNTPPVPLPPLAPGAIRSETYNRAFEIGKAVSVTRAPVGQVRRLSVAVIVRDTLLGAAKGQPAQIATLTSLVQSAVGFDARRGDVVTVAGRAFVPGASDPVQSWWEHPLVVIGTEGGLALVGLALLVFGVVRPLLRREPLPVAAKPADLPFPAEPNAAAIMVDYTVKLAETRALVGEDVGRASAVVRRMIRADAA